MASGSHSLGSMTKWAIQTHKRAKSAASHSDLQKVARTLYDEDSPSDLRSQKGMGSASYGQHLTFLQDIHDDKRMPVKVYPQPSKKDTPHSYLAKVGMDRASKAFSYRIMPKSRLQRRKGLSTIKSQARVTLSFDPSRSRSFSLAMADELTENRNVPQTKMMGPALLGSRTDDAILYMRRHSISDAIKTGKSFGTKVGGDTHFVDHTPFGMEPLPGMRGRSYSEAHPKLSSSHGTARKQVIASAVESFRGLSGKGGARATAEENMAGHIGYHAYRLGFNPGAPAFVATQARKEMLLQVKHSPTAKRVAKASAGRQAMLGDIRTRGAMKRADKMVGKKGFAASLMKAYGVK